MGALAGRSLCDTGAGNIVRSFLDDWSIATTATGSSDIGNIADANAELAHPCYVFPHFDRTDYIGGGQIECLGWVTITYDGYILIG